MTNRILRVASRFLPKSLLEMPIPIKPLRIEGYPKLFTDSDSRIRLGALKTFSKIGIEKLPITKEIKLPKILHELCIRAMEEKHHRINTLTIDILLGIGERRGDLMGKALVDEGEGFIQDLFRTLRKTDRHKAISILQNIRGYAYRKELPVGKKVIPIILKEAKFSRMFKENLRPEDMKRLEEIERDSWRELAVGPEEIQKRVSNGFAMVARLKGEIVAVIYGLIKGDVPKNFMEFTNHGLYTHDGQADTAYFYSVSTHKAVKGLAVGRKLVLEAIEEIRRKYLRVKEFRTLSPLRELRSYLLKALRGAHRREYTLTAGRILSFVQEETKDKLRNYYGYKGIMNKLGVKVKRWVAREEYRRERDEIAKKVLINGIEDGSWYDNKLLRQALEQILDPVVPIYLEKRHPKTGRLIDGVGHFHSGNGAWEPQPIILGRPEDRSSMGCLVSWKYPKESQRRRNVEVYRALTRWAKVGKITLKFDSLTQDDLIRIQTFVGSRLRKEGINFKHTQRVVRIAQPLARTEEANEDVVIAAAWLHDVAKERKGDRKYIEAFHELWGAEEAELCLLGLGKAKNFIQQVVAAILAHMGPLGEKGYMTELAKAYKRKFRLPENEE